MRIYTTEEETDDDDEEKEVVQHIACNAQYKHTHTLHDRYLQFIDFLMPLL